MKFSAVIFALVITSGFLNSTRSLASESAPSQNVSHKSIARFEEITLTRTQCFGWCPGYSVTIRGDGHVEYEGKYDVITKGRASKTLAKAEIDKLIQAANRAEYTSIPESSHRCNSDMPTTISSVTVEGKRHEIYICGSSGTIGHHKVGEFENAIDEIVGTGEWIGAERQRQVLFDGGYRSMRESAAKQAAGRGDIQYLEAHAELGEPESEFLLALGYKDGAFGLISNNHQKAVDLLIDAANRGYRPAQVKLMEMYESGVGVELNYGEAYFWRLVKAGWPSNKKIEGRYVENNLTQEEIAATEERARNWKVRIAMPSAEEAEKIVNKWLLKQAEYGDDWAQFDLGNFYLSEYDQTNYDPQKAEKWLHKAAERGNQEAKKKLSMFYERGGKDFPQNYKEAYFWARLADISADRDYKGSVAELLAKQLTAQEKTDLDKRIKKWKYKRRIMVVH